MMDLNPVFKPDASRNIAMYSHLEKKKLGHKNLDENTSLTMFAFLY